MSRPKFFISRSRFLKSRLFNWDLAVSYFWDLSSLFEIYWDILTLLRLFEVLQAQKSWQMEKSWSRNVKKLTNSQSRSRQTVKICQKIHVLTDFLISIQTFGTGRWCGDNIEISQSRSLRLIFWKCWDQDSQWRTRQDKLRPPGLPFWHDSWLRPKSNRIEKSSREKSTKFTGLSLQAALGRVYLQFALVG